jgi:hypothetical protein
MKLYSFLIVLFLVQQLIGQKSYYFSEPLPSVSQKTQTIAQLWHGTYSTPSVGRKYMVNDEGIYIISTTISFISRETLRESSKYEVRNDYLFGVKENDSIPCFLDDDKYYFGIRNLDLIFGEGSQNVLTRITDSEYILNVYENGFFIPSLIKFEHGKMNISFFDYETDTSVFDFIEAKDIKPSEYNELIVLTPNKSEFDQLNKLGIFKSSEVFKLER